MHRNLLRSQIEEHLNCLKRLNLKTQRDDEVSKHFLEFLESSPRCFERTHLVGHVTGSAFIFDAKSFRILLTHHKKLNKWLQLGGHSDGDHQTHQVALKEAEEESGLSDLHFFQPLSSQTIPFDLDIHEIPEFKDTSAHFHYDARYLIFTNKPEKINVSEESNDLKWFTLEEAKDVTAEESMLRQFDKFEKIMRVLR